MAGATANKAVKKTSAPKSSSKCSPSHPPYIQMITEALVALKERTGSSHHAIVKHIEEEQKIKDLPSNFKKILSVQLKKFVANGKLVMVKKSFKLPPKSTSAAVPEKKDKKPAAAAVTKTGKTSVSKPKAVVSKAGKNLKVVKSPAKKVAAVGKAKKPKSIKSPVKKVSAAAAAVKVTAKKAK